MGYVNYGYGMTYQNPYQNYQGQSYYGQQQMGINPNMPQMQVQQPQQNFIPMIYTNGVIGAKAYILAPNSTIFLKDSESNMIFMKKSDNEGKCTLSAYEMTPIQLDENDVPIKPKNEQVISANNKINYLTKEDLKDIVDKNDFKALQETFEERLNKLSTTIESLSKSALNTQNYNNNNNRNNNYNRGNK